MATLGCEPRPPSGPTDSRFGRSPWGGLAKDVTRLIIDGG
jgi:hypothetical protein